VHHTTPQLLSFRALDRWVKELLHLAMNFLHYILVLYYRDLRFLCTVSTIPRSFGAFLCEAELDEGVLVLSGYMSRAHYG
jgi:hypothetical protein